MIHKRGSIFFVAYLTDLFRTVAQVKQIKIVQSTPRKSSIHADIKNLAGTRKMT